MKKLLFLVIAIVCVACSETAQEKKTVQEKKYVQEAIDLNTKAVQLLMRNLGNKDSLNQALTWLNEALALDSTYLNAYGSKVHVLQGLSRYDEVPATMDEAIKQIPDYHGFTFMKGVMLEADGRKEEAAELYKKALELCESQMKVKNDVGLFCDYYMLKYFVHGIETTPDEMTAAIPSSFTEEEQKRVVSFIEMVRSHKMTYKDMKEGLIEQNKRK